MFILGHHQIVHILFGCFHICWMQCSLIVSILFCSFVKCFIIVPTREPVRKHFIFYILNIYVCTWLICIVHIHRHHTQRSLQR